jgi:hypothetical protein
MYIRPNIKPGKVKEKLFGFRDSDTKPFVDSSIWKNASPINNPMASHKIVEINDFLHMQMTSQNSE